MPRWLERARLAADVEREDDRRVGELELRVVVVDLGGLDAEQLRDTARRLRGCSERRRQRGRCSPWVCPPFVGYRRCSILRTDIETCQYPSMTKSRAVLPARPSRIAHEAATPTSSRQPSRRSPTRPPAVAELHRRPARRRGVRLPRDGARRPLAADGESSSEVAARRRDCSSARSAGHGCTTA